jgi:hypothetical protein
MDTCHWCNSPWRVPESTPPTWRVLDSHAEEVGEDTEIE